LAIGRFALPDAPRAPLAAAAMRTNATIAPAEIATLLRAKRRSRTWCLGSQLQN